MFLKHYHFFFSEHHLFPEIPFLPFNLTDQHLSKTHSAMPLSPFPFPLFRPKLHPFYTGHTLLGKVCNKPSHINKFVSKKKYGQKFNPGQIQITSGFVNLVSYCLGGGVLPDQCFRSHIQAGRATVDFPFGFAKK